MASVSATIKAFLQVPANVAVLADPDTSDVPPFRFANTQFTPPNPPAPWIAMSITGQLYGQVSIGANTQAENQWDQAGTLWFQVFTPVGAEDGDDRAQDIAKLLADMFRGVQMLDDDLEFYDAFIGSGGPSQEEGNWFELLVEIDWRRVAVPTGE